ncbi:MAG: hypothetical protein WDW38_003372 [Sanguina aurantia]
MNLIGYRRLGICDTKRTSLSVCRTALDEHVASHTEQTTSSKVHRSPLLDAVKERGDRSHEISLHVPGHKRGRGVSEKMESLTGPTALKYDLTELPGLDYLSSPLWCHPGRPATGGDRIRS